MLLVAGALGRQVQRTPRTAHPFVCWRIASATSIPESLVPKPRNRFVSGSDEDFNSWLAESNLQPGKAVLGAKLLKQCNAGSFYGVIVNPSIFCFLGAIWMEVKVAAMGQVFFKNDKLSTAHRANKWNFTLTHQADLNLRDITSSSIIMVDDKMYSRSMTTSSHKSRPFCVQYDDGDVGEQRFFQDLPTEIVNKNMERFNLHLQPPRM